MANNNSVEIDGVVVEALPNTMFRVKVSIAQGQEAILLATISGKMRTNYIRILPGDRVKVVVVPPDLTKGRITYRYK
jgi:translation initiation factor IF-1